MSIEVKIGREMALVRSCRRRGGDCPCMVGCKAETELLRVKAELQTHMDRVDGKLEWLRRVPATVRTDWKMPPKPDGDYRPVAYHDGDEWHPHWFSETESNDCIDITGPDAWPFVEETANSDDWAKLGFEVV